MEAETGANDGEEYSVLGRAESVEGIREVIQGLMDAYWVYHAETGNLLGVYDTREEAMDAIDRVSHDGPWPLDRYWGIKRGAEDLVWGTEPRAQNRLTDVAE